jgi:hypothetical protein
MHMPRVAGARQHLCQRSTRWWALATTALHCTACNKYSLEVHGTTFYGWRVPADTLWLILKSLAEGVGIRKVARIFEVKANEVLGWLPQVGDQLDWIYQQCEVHYPETATF